MGDSKKWRWHEHAKDMKKLDKRDDRPRHSVSVIIPCSHKHVQHLSELVAAYHAQTQKPEQIIVVVSGCPASALPHVDAQVIHSEAPQTAGSNRNRGSDVALGDILLYQDADDLPHPQRVEIVAGLFQKYRIDHLMHVFDRTGKCFKEEISLKKAAKHTTYRTKSYVGGVVHGNPAVARSVFAAVRWPEYSAVGEDLEFNERIYKHTKWTAVLGLPLYTYRQTLSSFNS